MLKPSDVALFQRRLDRKAPTKPQRPEPPEPPKGGGKPPPAAPSRRAA